MSGAHHHRAAAWELYFTTTARLTERIEAALKCQAGLSMPEYSVLLMTDRAGEAGIRPSVLAHRVVFSRSRLTHTMKRLVLDDITPEEIDMLTRLFTRVSARIDAATPCP